MTNPEPKKLMLLDTASLYYRAFFGVPATIKAPNGQPVNAVRGLLDFIARLVDDYSPTDLVATWDNDWRPQWRVDLIPSYKAHRVDSVTPATASDLGVDVDVEEMPDELSHQVEIIVEALTAAGICIAGADGYEADDVIGTLVSQTQSPTLVVTGDRDLFQLIDDAKPTKVLYTAARGVSNAEVMTNAEIVEKYGIQASQYMEFALLRGDSSDGLPGVKGIGEKTAAKLLTEFDTIENLYQAIDQGTAGLTPAMTAKFEAGREYVSKAEKVVQVAKDVPLEPLATTLPTQPVNAEQLAALAADWGLASSIGRLSAALAWDPHQSSGTS